MTQDRLRSRAVEIGLSELRILETASTASTVSTVTASTVSLPTSSIDFSDSLFGGGENGGLDITEDDTDFEIAPGHGFMTTRRNPRPGIHD